MRHACCCVLSPKFPTNTTQVTPLDVVRVRLQAQPIRPVIDPTHLTLANPSGNGVTACCREVFFASNTAEWCYALPRPIGASTGTSPSTTTGTRSTFNSSSAECAVGDAQSRTINSTLDGLRKIARNEGITTLWRGLSPTLVMTVPGNIIYYTGYEWMRHSPASPVSKAGFSDSTAPLLAGGGARMLAAVAVGPIELFRVRIQATPGASPSAPRARSHAAETFHGLREMVTQHGYRSLWRGITLTLWRDVPFSATYWWGYETVKHKLALWRRQRSVRDTADLTPTLSPEQAFSRESHADTFVDSFIAGATSGTVASTMTMPFDVGKTRTQVFYDSPHSSYSATASKSVSAATARTLAPEERSMGYLLWHIGKTEGIAGLWRGWIPRTLKVAPACAIMISSYEVGKRAFRGSNEQR